MNTFEKSIRCNILEYPLLYNTHGRARVLDQYFFTIGNGYEWRQGMLVQPEYRVIKGEFCECIRYDYVGKLTRRRYPDSVGRVETFEKWRARQKRLQNLGQLEKSMAEQKRSWKRDLVRAKYVTDHLEELAMGPVDAGWVHIYPLFKPYSRVFQLPADIRPEWLAGAVEALQMGQAYVRYMEAFGPDVSARLAAAKKFPGRWDKAYDEYAFWFDYEDCWKELPRIKENLKLAIREVERRFKVKV